MDTYYNDMLINACHPGKLTRNVMKIFRDDTDADGQGNVS